MIYNPLVVTVSILAAIAIGATVMPALGVDVEHPTPDAPAAEETMTPAPVPRPSPTATPTPTAVPTPTPDPQEIVGGYQQSTLTETGD